MNSLVKQRFTSPVLERSRPRYSMYAFQSSSELQPHFLHGLLSNLRVAMFGGSAATCPATASSNDIPLGTVSGNILKLISIAAFGLATKNAEPMAKPFSSPLTTSGDFAT